MLYSEVGPSGLRADGRCGHLIGLILFFIKTNQKSKVPRNQEVRDKISQTMKRNYAHKPYRIKDRVAMKYISLDISRGELEEYRQKQLVCEICGKEDAVLSRRLSVDHCHETNKFRGLLCTKCNMNFDWFLANSDAIIAYGNKNRE